MHECKQETAINMISQDIRDIRHEDLKTVNEKLDKLLAFKWKIVGATIATSAIVSFMISFILKKGG